MAGIVSYGCHVPRLTLGADTVLRAGGSAPKGSTRAVSNWDEDSITMAAEAGRNCLESFEPENVDRLYFASTTSPYREKQSASAVALAIDLRRDILTTDFAHSLRASTTALRMAQDAINAGSAHKVLVTAADCRLGSPDSELEHLFGDGSAALLLGETDTLAELEASYSHSDDFTDWWRMGRDTFVRSGEDRFIFPHGYLQNIREAVTAFLRQQELAPQNVTRVVLYAPDKRRHQEAVRALGFDAKTQVEDPLLDKVGNTGCAQVMLSLCSALDKAKPADRILVVGYGNGCDVLLFRVTDTITKARGKNRIEHQLETRQEIASYTEFLRFKELVHKTTDTVSESNISLPLLWRQRDQLIGLHGSRCNKCGTPQFPIQRICAVCRAKDDYEIEKFAGKKGRIFTFSIDHLVRSVPHHPAIRTVVDFDGGGRIACMLTDCAPDDVRVGMPVRMAFRKMQDLDNLGVYYYFWKAVPFR